MRVQKYPVLRRCRIHFFAVFAENRLNSKFNLKLENVLKKEKCSVPLLFPPLSSAPSRLAHPAAPENKRLHMHELPCIDDAEKGEKQQKKANTRIAKQIQPPS